MTDTPKTRIRALLALAAALALSLSFAGCKNFMKSDDDVKETMEQEVTVANAPEISVRVQSSAESLGSVTPNGKATFKLNVGSTLLASETAGGFIRWSAFYEADPATEVTDAVTFSALADGNMKEVTATVLQNRPDIVIQAMFEKRPAVTYFFPNSALYGDSYTNSLIRITFSKPINPDSLSTIVDGKTVSNISIVEYFAGTTKEISSTKFSAPSMSVGNTVVTLKNVDPMSVKNTVTVKVAKAVTDSSGLQMADDYSFSFMVGAEADKDPPVIGAILAGLTEAYEFPASEAARRVTGGTVYLILKGDDIGAGVEGVKIDTYLTKYDDYGTSPVSVSYGSRTFPWTDNAGTKTSFTDADLSASGVKDDGLVTFAIKLWDGNQNESKNAVLYRFVRDTTPPPVTPAQLARVKISGASASGYFNRNAILVFSQNGADPIVDSGFGGNADVPSLRSPVVYYRFALNASAFPDATSGWTRTDTGVAIPASGLSEGAAVPVLVQFKDDLGNVSAPANLEPLKIDNTPPTGSVTFNFPQINGLWQRNLLTAVPFVVTGNADISGVAKFYVSDAATAPTEASAWQDYTAGAERYFSFADGADGVKTLYAWFMDGAGNISASPATCQLVKDGTDPTVSKFFLRKKQAVTGSDDLTVPGDTQYSNDQWFYFAFVTQDVGAGPATFRYSDGASTSQDFKIASYSLPQGSGSLTVSNLMVSNTASGTLVLGLLTVSGDTQGAKSVTLWVTDAVGNVMDSGFVNSNGSCVYDSIIPTVVSLKATDAANNDITPIGGMFYSKDPSVKVRVQADDSSPGSGLDYAAFSAVSGGGSVASSTVSFGAGTTATTAVTLANEGTTNVIAAIPYDKAANPGTASHISLMLDRTAPELELYLFDPALADASCGPGNQKALKARNSTEEILYSASSSGWTSFKVGMIGYDNANGSGIKTTASHQYRLVKRTFPGGIQTDEVTAVSGNLIPSGPSSITIPPADLAKSAIWLLQGKAIDNVGNERASFESVGFAHDVNKPSIDNASVKVTTTPDTGASSVAKKMTLPEVAGIWPAGDYYFVPASAVSGNPSQTLYVQIMATDRPGSDPGGSGLALVNPNGHYRELSASADAAYSASVSCSETGYQILPKSGGATNWAFNTLAWMDFAPIFTDKCGNPETANKFIVTVDDIQPTASYGFSKWSNAGKLAGVTYIPDSATLSFTPSDAPSGGTSRRRPSGMAYYALTSSGTAPTTDPLSGDWKEKTDEALLEIPYATLQPLIGSSTTPLYLYLRDKVGNVKQISIGQTRIDTEKPTISGIRVIDSASGSDAYHDGAYYVKGTGVLLRATATDEANGSGAWRYAFDSAYFAVSGTVWTDDPVGPWSDCAEGAEFSSITSYDVTLVKARRFRVRVKDHVDNTQQSAASASAASGLEVIYDGTAPTTGVTLGNYLESASVYVSSGTTATLNLVDPVDGAGRPGSGVAKFIFQQSGQAAPTAASSGWIAYTGTPTDNTLAAGSLLSLVDGAHGIDFYSMDNVGNVSLANHLHGGKIFLIDNTPPDITDVVRVPTYVGHDGGYYVNKTPKASFSATDPGATPSGVFRYRYSANATENATFVNDTGGFPYSSYLAPDEVSEFETGTALEIYVHVTDNAGNVAHELLVDHPAKLDNTNPGITSVSAWDTAKGKKKKADADGVTDVRIDYPSNAELDSGLKKIRFSGMVETAQTGLEVWLNGTSEKTSSYDAGTRTLTLAAPIKLDSDGFLYVKNLKLSGSNPTYYVTFIDATGNASLTSPDDTIRIDSTAPAITFAMKDDTMDIATHSSEYSRATGTLQEVDSGIAEITLTGSDIDGLTTPVVTIGGTVYSVANGHLTVTGSSSPFTLTLDTAHGTVGTEIYSITGIKLKAPEGSKSITVKFTDCADLSDSESASITLDTTAPVPSVWASGGQNHYPTTKMDGSNTVEKTLSLWAKTGDTLTLFLYAADAGAGPSKYQVGTNPAVTNDSWGANGLSISVPATKQVQVWDKVGNRSTVIVSVAQDDVAPTYTLTPSGGHGVPTAAIAVTNADLSRDVYTTEVNFDFSFEANDNAGGSGLSKYTLDSTDHALSPSDPSHYTGTLSLPASGSGTTHTLTVTDNITGSPNVSKQLTLKVFKDNAGPAMTVTPTDPPLTGTTVYPTTAEGAEYYSTGSSMNFTVTATDDAGLGACTVSGSGASVDGSGPFTVTIPANGTTYTITVKDELGNSSTHDLKVTSDSAAPSITVKSPASDVLPANDSISTGSKTYYTKVSGSKTFKLTATDTTLRSYKIGTAPEENATTLDNADITVPVGTNTITVYDNLGHSSSVDVTLVYDPDAPETLKITPSGANFYPAGATNLGTPGSYLTKNGTLAVTLEPVDGESGIARCYATATGETTVEDTTSPYALSLKAGKTWTVYAVNNAGWSSFVEVAVTQDSAKPNNLSFAPSSGSSGNGWNKTSTTSHTYDANADMTFSLSADDTSGVLSVSISPSGAWTPGDPTQSDDTYSWTGITIPKNGTTYTLTLTDAVGNTETQTVKVTSDTTAPSFASCNWGTWNASGKARVNGIMQSPPTDIASQLYISDITGGTTDTMSTSNLNTNPTKDFIYDHTYTMTAKDLVGNASTVYFMCVDSGDPKLVRVNAPALWSFSGTTISGLGVYTTGTPSIVSSSGTYASSQITGFPATPSGNYTLESTLATKTMTITFSFSGGKPVSASVLGSAGIAARLSPETVTATVRKENFNRARSSSKTNLPVWFNEAGQTESSSTTRSSDRDRMPARQAAPESPGVANASRNSADVLQAAARTAFAGNRPESGNTTSRMTMPSRPESTGVETFVAVMTACEGSPAFVAYTRGVAALRDARGEGDASMTIVPAGFAGDREVGERPEGFWEKLLAFFGVDRRGGVRRESEKIGFVSE